MSSRVNSPFYAGPYVAANRRISIPRVSLTFLRTAITSMRGMPAMNAIGRLPWVWGTGDGRIVPVAVQARRAVLDVTLIRRGFAVGSRSATNLD